MYMRPMAHNHWKSNGVEFHIELALKLAPICQLENQALAEGWPHSPKHGSLLVSCHTCLWLHGLTAKMLSPSAGCALHARFCTSPEHRQTWDKAGSRAVYIKYVWYVHIHHISIYILIPLCILYICIFIDPYIMYIYICPNYIYIPIYIYYRNICIDISSDTFWNIWGFY